MAKQSIGIDCRLGGIAHAGIGRYIAELVKRITKSTQEIHWVLFCSTMEQAEELVGTPTPKNCTVILAPLRQYTLAEQLQLPKLFTAENLDLLHVPHFNVPFGYQGKFVVTIHDLLWHEYKGMHVTTLNPLTYWPKYFAYKFIARNAIVRAQHIFVPTQTVKKTITAYYPSVTNKITVTLEGIGSPLLQHTKDSIQNRKKQQLLYVGSLYPHKNVTIVLQALEQLNDYTLQIVGARTAFLDRVAAEVKKRNLSERVVFSGRLSDAELARAYQEATALVQPSVSEGFGLTGLEALAFKTPVIASDIPIFHEVYQDAAIYFDYASTQSCIAAIQKASQPAIQKSLAAAAGTVLKQYSWDTLAQQTLAGYMRVLKKGY